MLSCTACMQASYPILMLFVMQSSCKLASLYQKQSFVAQYADMAPDEPSHWPYRYLILMQLANTCELSNFAMEPQGQEWREKAGIYRQHAAHLSKRMGNKVSESCDYCNKPMRYKQPAEYATFAKTAVVVTTCAPFPVPEDGGTERQQEMCIMSKGLKSGLLLCI